MSGLHLYYSMKDWEMKKVTEWARGKINLTLAVLGRRPDGYHDLDTVMHSVTLADTVTVEAAETISLTVDGAAPAGRENLMWRAAECFFRETGIPGGAALHLTKRIPSEAGLGGGSADAAAVLRGLNRLTGAKLSAADLCAMAARIGADVPFCVIGGCARCRGVGDILTPLPPWEGLPLLIVRPPISVSTAKAYGDIDRRGIIGRSTAEEASRAISARDEARLAAALANTFEAVLCPAMPELAAVRDRIRSAGVPALMTGSGSAFFLLTGGAERKRLAAALRRPGWFVAEAETCGGAIAL